MIYGHYFTLCSGSTMEGLAQRGRERERKRKKKSDGF
jgi:hypothetical protein